MVTQASKRRRTRILAILVLLCADAIACRARESATVSDIAPVAADPSPSRSSPSRPAGSVSALDASCRQNVLCVIAQVIRAVNAHDVRGIEEVVNARWGVVLVWRPGAVTRGSWFSTAADLFRTDTGIEFGDIELWPPREAQVLPRERCDPKAPPARASWEVRLPPDAYFTKYFDGAKIAYSVARDRVRAQALERRVGWYVLDSGDPIGFYFAQDERSAAWYLVGVERVDMCP